jgi:hypothetical protein
VVCFAYHQCECALVVVVLVRKNDRQTDRQSLTRGRQEVVNHLQ